MTSKTKTKIICELHPQHRGDINDLESMILQCKMFGGDMVKLQLYDTLKLHGNTDRKHLEITAEELKRINKIGNIQTTNNSHFASIQKRIGKDSVFRLPIHPSLDGNTVEMAVEQMQFSENVMRYQTTLSFLNNKISGLRSAIKGE